MYFCMRITQVSFVLFEPLCWRHPMTLLSLLEAQDSAIERAYYGTLPTTRPLSTQHRRLDDAVGHCEVRARLRPVLHDVRDVGFGLKRPSTAHTIQTQAAVRRLYWIQSQQAYCLCHRSQQRRWRIQMFDLPQFQRHQQRHRRRRQWLLVVWRRMGTQRQTPI